MSVPSKQDFEDCIKLLSNFNLRELKSEFTRDIGIDDILDINPTYDEVKQYVLRERDLVDKKWEEITSSNLMIWLLEQPSFKRAYRSAFGRIKDEQPEKVIEQRIDYFLKIYNYNHNKADLIKNKHAYRELFSNGKLIDKKADAYIEARNTVASKHNSFISGVKRAMNRARGDFWSDLVTALKIYYYSDIELFNASTKEKINQALKTKREITKLLMYLSNPSDFYVRDNFEDKKQWKICNRAVLELEDLIDSHGNSFQPLERSGRTARERLLVFNLWETFQRQFAYSKKRTSKATAINHILSLEGIENAIEQRTIEKLIQGWKEKRRNLSIKRGNEGDYWEKRKELKRQFRVF